MTLWEVQAMFTEAANLQNRGTRGQFPSQDEVDAVMQEWREGARSDERI